MMSFNIIFKLFLASEEIDFLGHFEEMEEFVEPELHICKISINNSLRNF
jgi:hypothetical protein